MSSGSLTFVRAAFASCSLLVFAPSAALAQSSTVSHWGVGVTATPKWELADQLKKVIFEEEEQGTMSGSEFTVGLVRGSTRGGDVGLSFVRKPFKDGSGSTETEQRCFNQAQTQCRTETTVSAMQGVYLNGVQFHWFKPLVTIKNRAQIGFNIGAGVGVMKGNIVETRDGFEPVGFNPQTQQAILVPVHEVETEPAKDKFLPYFPLFKLEAEGALILAPGLKFKVAGGVNFPSISMRVGLIYLFGG